jgi:hypothetical protein
MSKEGPHALKPWVWVTNTEDSQKREWVHIVWWLCSDLRLLMLIMGYKAGGNYPCFMCMWHKQNALECTRRPRSAKDEDNLRQTAQVFEKVTDLDAHVRCIQGKVGDLGVSSESCYVQIAACQLKKSQPRRLYPNNAI